MLALEKGNLGVGVGIGIEHMDQQGNRDHHLDNDTVSAEPSILRRTENRSIPIPIATPTPIRGLGGGPANRVAGTDPEGSAPAPTPPCMRVRTRRFRSGDQGCPPSHDATQRSHPRHPMLPIRVLRFSHSPIRDHRERPRLGGRVSADQFGPSRHRVAPMRGTMASADFPGHFLPGISPDKSVLLPGTTAAFTSASEPLGFAVLCQLATSRRPSMRFLSVGPPVSHSLPPHGRLPFRSWLLVVVSSCFHVRFSHRGLAPHLQHAHAGRTQSNAPDFVPQPVISTFTNRRNR